jgi:hypothetical protein
VFKGKTKLLDIEQYMSHIIELNMKIKSIHLQLMRYRGRHKEEEIRPINICIPGRNPICCGLQGPYNVTATLLNVRAKRRKEFRIDTFKRQRENKKSRSCEGLTLMFRLYSS